MFARIASFQGGDVERLRELNEQRMSDGTAGLPEGLKSAMVLQDAANDRRLSVTFCDSRASVEAAERRFEEMGDEVPEEIRGTPRRRPGLPGRHRSTEAQGGVRHSQAESPTSTSHSLPGYTVVPISMPRPRASNATRRTMRTGDFRGRSSSSSSWRVAIRHEIRCVPIVSSMP